jgi:hypothetical protein
MSTPMAPPKPLDANVGKKGRPRVIPEELWEEWKERTPWKSYRRSWADLRAVAVGETLCELAGEE